MALRRIRTTRHYETNQKRFNTLKKANALRRRNPALAFVHFRDSINSADYGAIFKA